MKIDHSTLNRTNSLFYQKRRPAISQPKDINSKKHLVKMPFFQNLLHKDDYSNSIAKTLLKSVIITNLLKGETFALIDTPVITVNFLIFGELGSYSEHSNDSPMFHLINHYSIKEGEIFGTNITHYNYTLRALSYCIIGQITKEQFNLIMTKQNQYESKHDFSFFSNLSLFNGLRKNAIRFLIENSIKREMRKGERLTTQGTPFDSIFIVKKGQIKLSYTKKISFINDFDITFFQQLSDDTDRFSTQRQCELFPSYDEVKVYPLFIVCSGDIIGDFELKYKMKNYCFTGSCEIDFSIIYEITLDTFIKVIRTDFYAKFKTNLKPKETLFLNRLNTVVKNTKRPKSKYVLRIEDKMAKIPNEMIKTSFNQSHSKKRIQKIMKLRYSFDMNKLSLYVSNVDTKNNSKGNIYDKKKKSRNKRIGTEAITDKEIKSIPSRNNHNTFLSSLEKYHITQTPIKSYKSKDQELTTTGYTFKTKSCFNYLTQNKDNKVPTSDFIFETKKHLYNKCFAVNNAVY